MYHYITLWPVTIYMTGLGIIAFVVAFFLLVSYQARKYHLSLQRVVKYFPWYILCTYLLASYFFHLNESLMIIPTSLNDILIYLSPYEYQFHPIGVGVWVLVSGYHFMKPLARSVRDTRARIFLTSLSRALVPLGIFLLLWDSFIGNPTSSEFAVSAIRSDSEVAKYDKVLPLWLLLSMVGVVFGWRLYLVDKTMTDRTAYLWLGNLAIVLWFLLWFQIIVERLVVWFWSYRLSLTQYFFIVVAIGFYTIRSRRAVSQSRVNQP